MHNPTKKAWKWRMFGWLFGVVGAGSFAIVPIKFFRPETPLVQVFGLGVHLTMLVFFLLRQAIDEVFEDRRDALRWLVQDAVRDGRMRWAHTVLGVMQVRADYPGPSYPTRELAEKWGAERLDVEVP